MCVAVQVDFAQGKGRGGGGGKPAGVGNPGGGNRGIGNASARSGGRSDDGLGNAGAKSNGRSTAGLDRAQRARDKANDLNDNELNRYRGLSRKLGVTPEEMRARYEAALLMNPDLKYGQFVSAHVVSDNLGGRFPGITADAILAGYLNGDSLGQTLKSLRVPTEDAKAARKLAEARIKAAKDRNR
jgi:hypothetical protein